MGLHREDGASSAYAGAEEGRSESRRQWVARRRWSLGCGSYQGQGAGAKLVGGIGGTTEAGIEEGGS